MKKIIFTAFLIFLNFSLIAESSLQQKFIKGNINDKTAVIRQSSGQESEWLSSKAIDFALEYKQVLGDDRDLDAMVVAAVLSYTPEYVNSCSESVKQELLNDFIELFTQFNKSNTVQIAVVQKVVSLKECMSTAAFTDLLNYYLSSENIVTSDASLIKAEISALEYIGNNESFVILYNLWNNPRYASYSVDVENSLTKLIPVSMNEIIEIINIGNLEQIKKIYSLTQKNSQISQNLLCEIAENILNETILLTGNSSANAEDLVTVQTGSFNILCMNEWTRASSTALEFFQTAQRENSAKVMTDQQLINVIESLGKIAPLTAVNPLSRYLEDLNKLKETGNDVSDALVLSVIKSLGAIGDKSAFDSLLAVTYLNYPESVLAAAREALLGLKW